MLDGLSDVGMVWVKIKPRGIGPQVRSSMFPLTRVQIWVPMFDPQPYRDCLSLMFPPGVIPGVGPRSGLDVPTVRRGAAYIQGQITGLDPASGR